MPYIIGIKATRTVENGMRLTDWNIEPTRTAVATLDEAREAVSTALWENGTEPDSYRLTEQFDALPTEGGTIGPLPDDTVIEVRYVSWVDFGADVRERFGYQGGGHKDITAFNERSNA